MLYMVKLGGIYLSSHKSFRLSLLSGLVLILSGCPYEKYIYNLFSAIDLDGFPRETGSLIVYLWSHLLCLKSFSGQLAIEGIFHGQHNSEISSEIFIKTRSSLQDWYPLPLYSVLLLTFFF